ncbi:MAG: hypothetical protein KBE34_02250, partial [Veillonella sp.]|nr:hypothetical protein [Veillonella sp.]
DAPDAVVSSVKNGWAGIGYHFVIRKDGTIERGRPLSVVGAHDKGIICILSEFVWPGTLKKNTWG